MEFVNQYAQSGIQKLDGRSSIGTGDGAIGGIDGGTCNFTLVRHSQYVGFLEDLKPEGDVIITEAKPRSL